MTNQTIGYDYLLPSSATVTLSNLSVVSGSSTASLFTADLSDVCRLQFTGAGTSTVASITLAFTAVNYVGMIGILGHSMRPTATITPQFRGEIINSVTTQWDNDTPGVTGAYDTYSDCGDYAAQQWIRACFKSTFATSGTQRYTATAVRWYIKGLTNGYEFNIGRLWASRALTFRVGAPLEADMLGYEDPSIIETTNGGQIYVQERALRRSHSLIVPAAAADEVRASGGRPDYLDRVLSQSGRARPVIYMPTADPTSVDSYQLAVYGYLQSLRYGPINRAAPPPLHAADSVPSGLIYSYRSAIVEAR